MSRNDSFFSSKQTSSKIVSNVKSVKAKRYGGSLKLSESSIIILITNESIAGLGFLMATMS